ncbi:MAG TPA: cytochrome c oxidase subunit II [Solirubrobacteraceae bacterium]|jgi:cytochrome c oxidase subunit 2|nr:cytochrome c oxidase subunit II [Solirubrobacteraceae bacterium]
MSSSAAPSDASPPAGEPPGPNHLRRFLTIWIVASVIATPLVAIFLGPILPPGKASDVAAGQVTDFTVTLSLATPVLLLVVLYLIYAIVAFRQPSGAALEGPALRGHAGLQTFWIITSVVLILTLATYATFRLEQGYGAGSGSGPNPLTKPSGPRLPVQVIAQEWAFTYRYPTYGGVETTHLELPVNTEVELHVTSLDVIHSFWAYQLGVKADANPNQDNIAFVKPTKIETFEVHCAELCGIWHGAMFDHGHVVSGPAFARWIAEQQRFFAPVTKQLPKYSRTYLPEPLRRGE